MVSQVVATVVLILYAIYMIGWVRKNLIYEMYKLNNFVRALLIAVMCVNTYGGFIPLLVM